MATFTPNLNLELQGGGERASLVVLNENLTKLDTFAGDISELNNINYPISKGDVISSAVDFNTLTTPGVKTIAQNSVMSSCTNRPGDIGGRLAIWSASGTALTTAWAAGGQMFINFVGNQYMRSANTNGSGVITWSSWELLAKYSQITPLIGSNKTWITSANLNELTTTGLYMIGATPTNAPSDWGTLQVWSPVSNLIIQTYYRSGNVWTREYRSADGWSEWISLRDQITPVAGSATPSSAIPDSSFKVIKIGKLAYVTGYFKPSANIASGTTIATLSLVNKGGANHLFTCNESDGTGAFSIYVENNTGNIKSNSSTPIPTKTGSAYITFSTVYITE